MTSRRVHPDTAVDGVNDLCASTHHNPPVPAVVRGVFINPWAGVGPVSVAYCGPCAASLSSISPAGEPLFQITHVPHGPDP